MENGDNLLNGSIWVTSKFVGFHRWIEAPELVSFLRDWHRHIFNVRLVVSVRLLDREVEFFTLKKRVESYLNRRWTDRYFESSCEQIAFDLLREFDAIRVEVDEDGENGAVVETVSAERTQRRCFVGIEAEGPFRGSMGLFIPGSVSRDRIQHLISLGVREKYGVHHLYYGAGNNHCLSRDTLSFLATLSIPVIAEGFDLFEVEEFADLFRDSSVLISVSLSGENEADFRKEVVEEFIIWKGKKKGEMYVTSLRDPLFDVDVCVEEEK